MIATVTKEQARRIIDERTPRGLFLLDEQDGTFTTIDNETGDAWTENFKNRETAEHWLVGDFD